MTDHDATKAAGERAAEHQVDLEDVEGTGKDGRVTAPDVDAYIEDHEIPESGDGDDEVVDVADRVEDEDVEAATKEDQAEDAEAALEAHDIDPDELYAKEAVLPQNVQPSGGVIPPVEDQVGAPPTSDQLRQLAEQREAIEAIADATGWEQQEVEEPEEIAPEDADNPEPEEQIEPPPVEALEARKAEREGGPLPGSAEERQRDGASDDSVRQPLLQRPAEEQGGHATHQNSVYQEGETRPGERSLENDEPAYQVAANHVPGTPLPDEYYETAGPAPQPALTPKRTPEELDELKEDE